jgi:hypothetical protein
VGFLSALTVHVKQVQSRVLQAVNRELIELYRDMSKSMIKVSQKLLVIRMSKLKKQ